ncbi:retrovirus-related pol polyprotein from transposon TNT 1-94 [Tanacetum coccineum]
MKVKESLNVTFDESPPPTKLSPLVDDDVGEEEAIENNTKVVNNSNKEDESIEVDEVVNIKESKNHPLEQVIEPKNVNEALGDESWVIAMQEELNQFVANDVWDLVPLPMSQTVIGTKWVFRNKLDENGIVSRNKARLVAQGYNQQEGIEYDETYAPVARLESIRILLAIACANDFKLYQMDIKSAFLNGFVNKEVYVAQPLENGNAPLITKVVEGVETTITPTTAEEMAQWSHCYMVVEKMFEGMLLLKKNSEEIVKSSRYENLMHLLKGVRSNTFDKALKMTYQSVGDSW